MKPVHKRALNFAANHFAISFVAGVICLIYFHGSGHSDVANPDPSWMKALLALLWVLQLPVAAFEAVALRQSPIGANVLLLCLLGFLWSLVLGYVVPPLAQAVRKWANR